MTGNEHIETLYTTNLETAKQCALQFLDGADAALRLQSEAAQKLLRQSIEQMRGSVAEVDTGHPIVDMSLACSTNLRRTAEWMRTCTEVGTTLCTDMARVAREQTTLLSRSATSMWSGTWGAAAYFATAAAHARSTELVEHRARKAA
jgi:hypothetical protein